MKRVHVGVAVAVAVGTGVAVLVAVVVRVAVAVGNMVPRDECANEVGCWGFWSIQKRLRTGSSGIYRSGDVLGVRNYFGTQQIPRCII